MPVFIETRMENSCITHTFAPRQIINVPSFNLLSSKQLLNLSLSLCKPISNFQLLIPTSQCGFSNTFLDEIIPIYSPLKQIISPSKISQLPPILFLLAHKLSIFALLSHSIGELTLLTPCLLITTGKFCFSQHLSHIPHWNCLQANPPPWSTLLFSNSIFTFPVLFSSSVRCTYYCDAFMCTEPGETFCIEFTSLPSLSKKRRPHCFTVVHTKLFNSQRLLNPFLHYVLFHFSPLFHLKFSFKTALWTTLVTLSELPFSLLNLQWYTYLQPHTHLWKGVVPGSLTFTYSNRLFTGKRLTALFPIRGLNRVKKGFQLFPCRVFPYQWQGGRSKPLPDLVPLQRGFQICRVEKEQIVRVILETLKVYQKALLATPP